MAPKKEKNKEDDIEIFISELKIHCNNFANILSNSLHVNLHLAIHDYMMYIAYIVFFFSVPKI